MSTPSVARGRTIKLFLAEGSPTGLMTAEIMNWSGKALVVPRASLGQLAAREEAKRTGVYVLVGADPDSALKSKAYIGESDNCYGRITAHDKNPDNDFCTRVVLLVSKDSNLTKAHARYLENRLILLAKDSGRATLANGNDGAPVSLPESDVADMEGFLEQVQMILPVLGIDIFEPKVDASAATPTGAGAGAASTVSPTFEVKVVGAAGRARQVGSQFFLLKGSTARIQGVPAWTSYRSLRDQLVKDKKLVPHPTQPDYYVVAEDLPLNSPSAGAAIVAARNMNGRVSWKVEGTNETYQDWYEKQLDSATTNHVGTNA